MATGRERLEYLATLLERPLPEGVRFDLSEWGHKNCETVCCAVGLATTDAWMQSEGLEPDGKTSYTPWFKGAASWRAVERFFEINTLIAHRLFDEAHYDDISDREIEPADVAERIRIYLSEGVA